MENMGLKKLTAELQRLNRGANIISGVEGKPKVIFGTLDPEQLAMPEGYYYSEKNGITNKHNTESGIYEAYQYMVLFKSKKTWFERIFGK